MLARRTLSGQQALHLLDDLPTAVIVLDTDLTILAINTAAEDLLDLSAGRYIGYAFRDLLPAETKFSQRVARALEEGRSFRERDMVIQTHNATSVVVDCTVSPWWERPERPARMVIELNSVERHHRIQTEEALLMQTQASAAVMRGLAHEVKNPLGGIRGAAQLLERELEDQRQAEYTQIIIGEVDRLRNLVDRMLGPPGEPCAAPVNIHDVLEHVTHIVDAESAGSSVIRRDYDPSIPELFADRDQLIQAFLNIVRNAMQALHAVGGTIELKTRIQRNLTIGPKMHSLVARVDVIDSGPGVNPEIADSIFYPMVSGRAEGSGLGLPLAQSLLNRQGGLVEFASEPGHTVFTVWLPIGTEK